MPPPIPRMIGRARVAGGVEASVCMLILFRMHGVVALLTQGNEVQRFMRQGRRILERLAVVHVCTTSHAHERYIATCTTVVIIVQYLRTCTMPFGRAVERPAPGITSTWLRWSHGGDPRLLTESTTESGLSVAARMCVRLLLFVNSLVCQRIVLLVPNSVAYQRIVWHTSESPGGKCCSKDTCRLNAGGTPYVRFPGFGLSG
jgi:hypothetical protein